MIRKWGLQEKAEKFSSLKKYKESTKMSTLTQSVPPMKIGTWKVQGKKICTLTETLSSMRMLSNGNVQGKYYNEHTDTNSGLHEKYWYWKSTRKAPKRALRQNVSYIKKHWHWKNTRKAPKWALTQIVSYIRKALYKKNTSMSKQTQTATIWKNTSKEKYKENTQMSTLT